MMIYDVDDDKDDADDDSDDKDDDGDDNMFLHLLPWLRPQCPLKSGDFFPAPVF